MVTMVGAVRAEDKSDILQQKKELEKIQKEVEQGRQRLDSLKNVEVNVQKQVSEFDQKITTNHKVIARLNREMQQIKSDIASAEQRLGENQEDLDRLRRRYLGNIRQFYFATQRTDGDFVDEPNAELELNRKIIYLAAVAGFESGNVEQANNLLGQSHQQLTDLGGRKSEVSQLKKKKETSTSLEESKKKKQEKALEKLRRQKMDESERIMTLQQAAREMEGIIARLEKARLERRQAGQQQGPSVFASLRGQLPSPFQGKIVVPFGNSTDPITKLKSFSPGITIEGRAGREVIAVAAGLVAYVGNLRGYGNFVIINHDNQYYTTYAGMGQVSVTEGQYLLPQGRLGISGPDGLIKFELREGRQSLDPVEWIRIDSF
jgi:septal ring factor EnvC (AmiA/AmiB activator)